ncbi:hypothetical protein [Zophobihabitans entericus]|uniref:DUF340 domain-containing protein n=1 Tax=Zophobihabitans entericus TaxID=1635327 RepID=A0A6G9IAK9_9GAMM|nr:hypothetical protein [Zophobihabitans entericus]QIQ21268.1 hypothetical protein IPMB12_05955 [Zophobihabitans entericus]
MKISETIFVLILVAVIMAAGNSVGYPVDIISSLKGMAVLVVISVVGFLIAKLPVCNKLPVIFWVSIIAIISSLPVTPGSAWVLDTARHVQFLAICTPILAYAGLAIGKDLAMFKQISWRIIPVALAVCAGTFLCAAFIAQVTLHLEGVI